MRITTVFKKLLDLGGVRIRSVVFGPGKVVIGVALRCKLLHCPLCDYSTAHRHNLNTKESVLEAPGPRHLEG